MIAFSPVDILVVWVPGVVSSVSIRAGADIIVDGVDVDGEVGRREPKLVCNHVHGFIDDRLKGCKLFWRNVSETQDAKVNLQLNIRSCFCRTVKMVCRGCKMSK